MISYCKRLVNVTALEFRLQEAVASLESKNVGLMTTITEQNQAIANKNEENKK